MGVHFAQRTVIRDRNVCSFSAIRLGFKRTYERSHEKKFVGVGGILAEETFASCDVLIIGSGPAALASFWAIPAETDVMVLDTGFRVGRIEPSDSRRKSSAVLGRKEKFGSSYTYEYSSEFGFETSASFDAPVSGARGGFTTTWGAGLQVLSSESLVDWPVSPAEMKVSYLEILSRIPTSGNNHDSLSLRFPWPTDFQGEIPKSKRMSELLASVEGMDFSKSDCLMGSARLAVATSGSNGCQLCGMCLSGCPYGSIFDAGEVFDRIELDGGARFVNGTALKLTPRSSDILVEHTEGVIAAHRVILAAGVIPSTAILQKSKLAPPTLYAKDSQVFFTIAVSRNRATSDAENFTMAQVFAVSSNSKPEDEFHLSLYDYDRSFSERASQLLRKKVGVSVPVPRGLFRNTIPGIGFVSSRSSGSVELRSVGEKVNLTPVMNPKTKDSIRKAVKSVDKALRPTGVRMVKSLTQVPGVGRGYHLGSSLPLGSEEIDDRGRLRSDPRISCVDGSVLPSIFAGPHTLTIMANSYRCTRKNFGS